jgi:hypothetical protein
MLYLIHFSEPIGDTSNPKGWAQHYSGAASDLESRLLQHKSGFGAKIMAAVERAGIAWTVAAVWEGGFEEEKLLKIQHNNVRYCPICRQQKLLKIMGL